MLALVPFDIDMEWSLEPPGLVARCVPPAKYANRGNTLHGGIAALLLDETMAALGQTLAKSYNVTGTRNLQYRQPIPLDGRPLRVEAWFARHPPSGSTRVVGFAFHAHEDVMVQARGLGVEVITHGTTMRPDRLFR